MQPPVRLLHVLYGHQGMITSLAWEPHGHVLASAALDKTVRVWDVARGGLIKTGEGHGAGVTSVAWAPEGEALASVSQDRSLRLWRYPGLDALDDLPPLEKGIAQVVWAPTGKTLVTISHEHAIQIWDVRNRKLQTALHGHESLPRGAAFSVKGEWLATFADSGRVRLWKGGAFTPDKILSGHESPVNHAAWSTSDLLATASDDHTVRIWDVRKGECIQILDAHDSAVKGLAFSSDGRLLASRAWDETLRLWRSDTWTPVAMIEEDSMAPWPVLDFHPREPLLASVGLADQVIRIWELNMDQLSVSRPAAGPISHRALELELLREMGVEDLGVDVSPRPASQDPSNAVYLECPQCEGAFTERDVADRQARGLGDIVCPLCDTSVPLETDAEIYPN